MAKIDTLFMTKTAEKPYPLGPQIPICTVAHITEYPPRVPQGLINAGFFFLLRAVGAFSFGTNIITHI